MQFYMNKRRKKLQWKYSLAVANLTLESGRERKQMKKSLNEEGEKNKQKPPSDRERGEKEQEINSSTVKMRERKSKFLKNINKIIVIELI